MMFRTIRNHWKKSLFAFCALSYGAKWSYDRYQANQIRQFYCRQARLLGSQFLPSMARANRVAVLLNAKSNNGKARSIYDKTVFPLLSLIGVDVRVYRLDTITDPNGLNELLTNKIEPNELNALVIVGGDGTLSELAPHLLQSDVLQNLPICIVPIGEHVSFGRRLFPKTNKKKLHDDVGLLCESVFALFTGKIVQKHLLKITMSDNIQKPIYASTFDLGQYTRLELLQKRLWYFSYLKYPITSIYHYLTNSSDFILSPDQPSVLYSRPCSGCLRCQPTLLDHYRLSQKTPKSSLFSSFYRSSRTNRQPSNVSLPEPIENPDCGVEHSFSISQPPVQLSAKLTNDDHNFQVDISDRLERFNYNKENQPKQTVNVQYLHFHSDTNLIKKHLLINNEKLNQEKENNYSIEYRIGLSEKPLKFLEINEDALLTKRTIVNKSEDDDLDKKGIFLFSRYRQQRQTS